MKAKLNFRGKEIEFDIEKCSGFKRFLGLMFKSRDTNALLFDFEKQGRQAIHSFFCHNFLAIWIDKNNKVLDHRIITSNKIIESNQPLSKLVEIPLNNKYAEITKLFLENKKKHLNTISS